MIEITKENFQKEIEENEGLALVDLWAPWCGPCRMLAPVLSEMESECEDVKFCKINVDEQRELAELFKVENIPMIALVKNNVFLDFTVGYVPKQVIKDFIDKYRQG